MTIGIGVAVSRPGWVKTLWLLTAGLIIAIVAVVALVYAYVGHSNSDEARLQAVKAELQSEKAEVVAAAAQQATLADCPTWHDASVIPLAAATTKQGLLLFADFRRSYFTLDCADVLINGKPLGALPPADPKLYPYLPVGDR